MCWIKKGKSELTRRNKNPQDSTRPHPPQFSVGLHTSVCASWANYLMGIDRIFGLVNSFVKAFPASDQKTRLRWLIDMGKYW
jgi:hypothetical protein